MGNTNNNKIAEWLGFRAIAGSVFLYEEERGWYRNGALPDYASSDSDAITLLPKLVELGYETSLIFTDQGANFDIGKNTGHVVFEGESPTICGAISAAVVKLIESI